MPEGNSIDALDLYAKIEDLIGVQEVAPKLYEYYYKELSKINFNSLLDIGCGKGIFLSSLKKRYENRVFLGIDRSPLMVKEAKKTGVNAKVSELNEIKEQFDIATATFDMINYLAPQEFIDFFEDLKKVVKSGGYFIFDVNSEFGLSEVAVGNFISDSEDRFLAIESFYEGGVYDSYFTLFEKNKQYYIKETQSIKQFYYSEDFFMMLGGWELIKKLPIKLYGFSGDDKIIYVLKKIC